MRSHCDTHGGVAYDLHKYDMAKCAISVFVVFGKELMRCDTDADLFEGR